MIFSTNEQAINDRNSANSSNRLIRDYSSSTNFTEQKLTSTSNIKKKRVSSIPEVRDLVTMMKIDVSIL
jgi:transcriptional regulator of met regulon